MDKIQIMCPAKINLSLDVVGKREDGYHLLSTVMQSVSLFDEIIIKRGEGGINLYCSRGDIPCNPKNTAYKAAKLIADKFGIDIGVDIIINKNIPVAAGLAGGSTDAAGVIDGMNSLFDLKMSGEEMREIGLKIGADVPYCIMQRTALAEGIGEKLTPITPLEEVWCVLAKPPIAVSTAEVYGELNIDEIPRHPNTSRIIECINKKDLRGLGVNMANVLESVTIKKYPVIFEIKNIMMEFNSIGSIMSGSGPTVFGLFERRDGAEICYNRLKDYLKEVYIVKTFNKGV